MIGDFARHAATKLDKERESYQDRIVGGGATDYAHYRHQVGYAAGLQRAAEILKQAAKEYDPDE